MDAQEIFQVVENLQKNITVGIVVVIYYLIVYWQRIKDGLGLSRDKKRDLDKVEKSYQLLKLRIEIEKIKKESGLDQALLEKLEQEMQAGLEDKGKSFTNIQKFLAIPLIILVVMQGVWEIQAIDQDTGNTELDVIFGMVFVVTTIIVGFWGIPVLQRQQKGWLRKTGFTAFWTIGFYILVYILVFLIYKFIYGTEQVPGTTLGLIFLISLVCSIFLGYFGKLPFMNTKTSV